jgi:hypothetical protein
MAEQTITVSLDGKTYTGGYELVGHGEAEAVSVQYEGSSISARPGLLRVEVVAETLLGELIRAKLVDEAERQSLCSKSGRAFKPMPVHYQYGCHKPELVSPRQELRAGKGPRNPLHEPLRVLPTAAKPAYVH